MSFSLITLEMKVTASSHGWSSISESHFSRMGRVVIVRPLSSCGGGHHLPTFDGVIYFLYSFWPLVLAADAASSLDDDDDVDVNDANSIRHPKIMPFQKLKMVSGRWLDRRN